METACQSLYSNPFDTKFAQNLHFIFSVENILDSLIKWYTNKGNGDMVDGKPGRSA